jgi:hypothetical protein
VDFVLSCAGYLIGKGGSERADSQSQNCQQKSRPHRCNITTSSLFGKPRESTRGRLYAIEILEVYADRDFDCRSFRADSSTVPCLGGNLHRFGFAGAKSLQARVLREQDLLRNFEEQSRSGFAAAREE